MKKYFVVSDIHSFYAPLKKALYKAGFRKTNKEHILIVCGDVFDRGEETMKVYQFLRSIPKNRCILVKGNHESLFEELLTKTYPDDYDFSNGTVKTFCAIAWEDEEVLSAAYYFKNNMGDGYYDRIRYAWKRIVNRVKESEVYKWLKSDQWKDYYELNDMIFVHSFIPLKAKDGLPFYYTNNRDFEYFSDWRTTATEEDWEAARWGCPWKQYKYGYFAEEIKNGKKLVVGHWHTSDFWENLSRIYDHEDEIYYDGNIIAIDGGVRYSYDSGRFGKRKLVHKQNVLVACEDGVLLDVYGLNLEPANQVCYIETVPAKE